MRTPGLMAAGVAVLIVLGALAYRLLWLGSQAAGAAGLGRLPRNVQRWVQRWLLGDGGAAR